MKNIRIKTTVPELVEAMTNHERHVWARKGYPKGKHKQNVNVVAAFIRAPTARLKMRRAQPGWRHE